MPKTDAPPTSTIIWRPTDTGNYRPDTESEILIYDGYLDDVVKGYMDVKEDWLGADPVYIWIDQTTGDPLPDPQMWTDVPFPEIIPPVTVNQCHPVDACPQKPRGPENESAD